MSHFEGTEAGKGPFDYPNPIAHSISKYKAMNLIQIQEINKHEY